MALMPKEQQEQCLGYFDEAVEEVLELVVIRGTDDNIISLILSSHTDIDNVTKQIVPSFIKVPKCNAPIIKLV